MAKPKSVKNPKGRGLNDPSATSSSQHRHVEEVLQHKVTVRVGGKAQQMTMVDAAIQASAQRALAGSLPDMLALLTMALKLGLFDGPPLPRGATEPSRPTVIVVPMSSIARTRAPETAAGSADDRSQP